MSGDRKAFWAHEMRRDAQPDVALGQSRAHAQKASALEHREIAVDQPWRGLGRARGEVALLQKDHPQAASRGVARNADTVQTAADDRKSVVRHGLRLEHDPEKWKPVFPRDKREALARRSCSTKNEARD